MSMNKERTDLRKNRSYEEIRGSGLNRALCWPARVLVCVLAVLMFLGMSNPAQTALLGRASLADLALNGESKYDVQAAGLAELQAAEGALFAQADALENAAAGLEASGDTLRAPDMNLVKARLAVKDVRKSVDAAQAALDGTLGAEAAACEAVLASGDDASLTHLQTAAEAMKAVTDAQAALAANPGDADATAALNTAAETAMYLFWDISMQAPELADVTDGAAMTLSDAMWYAPMAEGDPTWEEKMAEAVASANASINGAVEAANAQAAEQAALKEQAQAMMAQQGTALADTQAAIDAVTVSLDVAEAAVKEAEAAERKAKMPNATEETKAASAAATEKAFATLTAADEQLNNCAAALRSAQDASTIAGTELTASRVNSLRLIARLLMAAVVLALAGMIVSLGNNRMRKVGLLVLTASAAAAVALLVSLLGVHAAIAANVETMTAAFGLTAIPQTLTDAVSKLALDVPDALWVCLTVAALAALCGAAAWLTLPRKTEERMQIDLLTIFQNLTRVLIVVTGMLVFLPTLNPGRVSELINENASLFTVATSYGTIVEKLEQALAYGIIADDVVKMLMLGAAVVMLGILLNAAGACMSLGNNRMKKKGGYLLPMAGSAAILGGLFIIFNVYNTFQMEATANAQNYIYLKPMLPGSLVFWAVAAALVFICSFVSWYLLPDELEEKMEMEEKYRNFLMFLPVLLLTFIFCYLPIYGWRFAFFDYKIGDQLLLYDTVVDGVVTQESNYVGLKWFTYLFENPANRDDLIRVLRNTLIMSGLGIATSWLPIAFAVLLAEVRSSKFQRIVQTLTTIPNFISWVLVYAIAFAIFSTDGFINSFLRNVMGIAGANTDYLASADWIWVKMLLWGTWKGLGWSAIVYIAGIAGIDQQLYEAARVDGANRFQCIRHITIPGLMPTYMVMLLMSVAGMLSNGMDQYLVFENAINKDVIEVLDLYVYNIGIKSGLIPLSTVVGVFKSLIGVTLLFGANGISKAVRGESII